MLVCCKCRPSTTSARTFSKISCGRKPRGSWRYFTAKHKSAPSSSSTAPTSSRRAEAVRARYCSYQAADCFAIRGGLSGGVHPDVDAALVSRLFFDDPARRGTADCRHADVVAAHQRSNQTYFNLRNKVQIMVRQDSVDKMNEVFEKHLPGNCKRWKWKLDKNQKNDTDNERIVKTFLIIKMNFYMGVVCSLLVPCCWCSELCSCWLMATWHYVLC